jgi:2-pyrone-4,6-dicarboxylate lactonase
LSNYHPNPGRPRFMPPPGACDTHFHVFDGGPGEQADPKAGYKPVVGPMRALDTMHRALGIERGVLVQNTAVKADYAAFSAQLRSNARFRGVAVMDDATSDADLEKLHAAGVRGVRFHFAAFLKKRPTMATFMRSVERIRPLGWHVLVHVLPQDLLELAKTFEKLPVTLIIDHIAHIDCALGVEQPAFRALLDLHRREHCWVKISNSDRWSAEGPPHYRDAVPFGRALARNAPERLLWGTDWPHVLYKWPDRPSEPPDEAHLLNLLYEMVPDAAVLKKILVDNPQRLYAFDR